MKKLLSVAAVGMLVVAGSGRAEASAESYACAMHAATGFNVAKHGFKTLSLQEINFLISLNGNKMKMRFAGIDFNLNCIGHYNRPEMIGCVNDTLVSFSFNLDSQRFALSMGGGYVGQAASEELTDTDSIALGECQKLS